MLIYTKCLTYGYKGKDHLIRMKKDNTFLDFKEEIIKLFKVDKKDKIQIFDDKTERVIDYDDDHPILDCFSPDSFYSVSFHNYS